MTSASHVADPRPENPALVARIRASDPAAFQSVVEMYLPQIRRAARGAGLTPDEAEDVTQATVTTFLETAARFEGRSRVRTWLFGILYKKIAETRRARQRSAQMDSIDETFAQRLDATGGWSTPPTPIDVTLQSKDVEGQIFSCLDEAPLRQSLASILREVEELSTEEVCEVLGVTATNLGVMLHRLRHRMRDCLEAMGVRKSRPDADV